MNGKKPAARLSRHEQLVEAARSGDMQTTIELLRNIPGEVGLGKNGELALQEMVRHGHMAVIGILIAKGVSAVATNSEGYSPLHIAVMNGHEHIARFLINNVPEVKENINQVCSSGLTAYELAGQKRSDTICKMLVEFGAEERSTPSSNPSPTNNDDYVPRLLETQNRLDQTVLDLQRQIVQMGARLEAQLKDMKRIVKKGLDNQSRDSQAQLLELRNRLDKVEENIIEETEAINAGMDTLRTRTDELCNTIHQSEEYNEIVYFHVFQIIARTVGIRRDSWKELANSLMDNYPRDLVQKIITEVQEKHTTETDMAWEILTKWKVHNKHRPGKVDTLKAALRRAPVSRFDSLIHDIDFVLDQEKTSRRKNQPKDKLSDKLLLELANNISQKDYIEIGVSLGIRSSKLNQLREDNSSSSVNRNFTMLTHWRDKQEGCKTTTQSQLIEALKAAGRLDLVEKVADYIGT